MGPEERARHDAEADAFFAKFVDASTDLIAEVWADKHGDIDTVASEAHGYWTRKMLGRAARRALRELAATRAQQEQQDRLDALASPAPAAPAPADGQQSVVLPERRIVILTDEERTESNIWWQRLVANKGVRILATRIRSEIRKQKQDDLFAARADAAWRMEQRAFERAQWREVIATRAQRKQRKVANTWSAISEDRAMQIAIAALEKIDPPQGRK